MVQAMIRVRNSALPVCVGQAVGMAVICGVVLLLAPVASAQQEVADDSKAHVRDWSKVILVREPTLDNDVYTYYDRVTGQQFEHRGFSLFIRGGGPSRLKPYFSGGLALVWEFRSTRLLMQDGPPYKSTYKRKIGYIDRSGQVVIPCRYNGAEAFDSGRAWVNLDGKDGIIDTEGRWVVKPGTYAWLGYFREGRCAFSADAKEPRKYGFLDRGGAVVIPPIHYLQGYRADDVFREGFCAVKDSKGICVYIDLNGRPRVRLPKGWWGRFFSEGFVCVYAKEVLEEVAAGHDCPLYDPREIYPAQYGYMRSDNSIAIPPRFATAGDFSEGLAPVTSVEDGMFNNFRRLAQWDREIRELKPLSAAPTLGWFSLRGYGKPPCGPRRWGFIDKSGNVVIPMIYERAGHFSQGLAPVMKDDLWGYIDRAGRMVIEPRFIWAWEFEDGVAEVYLDDGTGNHTSDGNIAYIDKTGRVFLQTEIKRADF